jgi:hypothetical protein
MDDGNLKGLNGIVVIKFKQLFNCFVERINYLYGKL